MDSLGRVDVTSAGAAWLASMVQAVLVGRFVDSQTEWNTYDAHNAFLRVVWPLEIEICQGRSARSPRYCRIIACFLFDAFGRPRTISSKSKHK